MKKGATKRVNLNTVNGKKALYQNTAAEFQAAAAEMMQSGAREMQAGVHAMQIGIKEQINKYNKGTAAFQAGVADMLSGIVAQVKATQKYTKMFYGWAFSFRMELSFAANIPHPLFFCVTMNRFGLIVI